MRKIANVFAGVKATLVASLLSTMGAASVRELSREYGPGVKHYGLRRTGKTYNRPFVQLSELPALPDSRQVRRRKAITRYGKTSYRRLRDRVRIERRYLGEVASLHVRLG